MADTIRETILAAIEAALSVNGKPPGLNVHRFRTRPLDKDDMDAMVVYPIDEDTRLETHDEPSVRRVLMVRLEHRVVSSADSPDKTLDPLLAWGTKALLTDAALDALIVSIEEVHTGWASAEMDKLYGGAAQDFRIEFATIWDDQETAA